MRATFDKLSYGKGVKSTFLRISEKLIPEFPSDLLLTCVRHLSRIVLRKAADLEGTIVEPFFTKRTTESSFD
jgi:hypothetical protein